MKILTILFLLCGQVFAQTIGDSRVGIQKIEVSLNRSRIDTVITVGPQVEFIFPEGLQRIATIWRAWPGIGHVAEKDVLLTDGGIVLPVSVGYKQIIFFGVWSDDYIFPIKSREYFIVALRLSPRLDVNEDGTVNVLDRERLQKLLGTRSADRRYDPRCDFNNDGWIDRLDWLTFGQGKY